MCITFSSIFFEKRSTSTSRHLFPSGCLYGGAPSGRFKRRLGSRAEPFGHPRTDSNRSGSGPLRVTLCNLIFTKNYISFSSLHATAPSFFRPAHLLHLSPQFPKRPTNMRAGRKGGFRGKFRPALHLVFFLRLFRTIFSFLRNCAAFWLKFELFSLKILNADCAVAPLGASFGRRGRRGSGRNAAPVRLFFRAGVGKIFSLPKSLLEIIFQI